jgi:hydroxymethylbilane synthase
MPDSASPVVICTRGSALALAQANAVLAHLKAIHRNRTFELRIVKTTGDKLQTAQPGNATESVPRGLFTKELEEELLAGRAQIAVHSLKDLPTELPAGLKLAGTPPRADVREVLLFRSRELQPDPNEVEWSPGRRIPFYGEGLEVLSDLPKGAIIATSSPRRSAQLRHIRPDLEIAMIRGNVGTRLQKVATQTNLDATLLAAAGLTRLHFDISPKGQLRIDPRLPASFRQQLDAPPAGILATVLEPEEMLPAVGQGAVGLEIREDDAATAELCLPLNHFNTFAAVQAERSFLQAMGGGCQTPVAAYARVVGHQLFLRAATYVNGTARFAEGRRVVREAEKLGESVAADLKRQEAGPLCPTPDTVIG